MTDMTFVSAQPDNTSRSKNGFTEDDTVAQNRPVVSELDVPATTGAIPLAQSLAAGEAGDRRAADAQPA